MAKLVPDVLCVSASLVALSLATWFGGCRVEEEALGSNGGTNRWVSSFNSGGNSGWLESLVSFVRVRSMVCAKLVASSAAGSEGGLWSRAFSGSSEGRSGSWDCLLRMRRRTNLKRMKKPKNAMRAARTAPTIGPVGGVLDAAPSSSDTTDIELALRVTEGD